MTETPRNPVPTVDIIDYGESAEAAAVREAREETGLEVTLLEQFHTFSHPDRDPRQHTLSVVFIARAVGEPQGADDAVEARAFEPERLPEPLAFDHKRIISDYLSYKRTGIRGTFTLT